MTCSHQRVYDRTKFETATEKADFIMSQIRTMREKLPFCRCYCGMKIYLPLAFRCLYCGEWYCQSCAEEHFGETRKEWATKNANNIELEQALQDAKL